MQYEANSPLRASPALYSVLGEGEANHQTQHKLTPKDSSCRLIIICGKSPRRQFLRVLVLAECGEIAGSFPLGVTGHWDFIYAAIDHGPARGLTRDSNRVRCVSRLPLLLGAPEGSCLP